MISMDTNSIEEKISVRFAEQVYALKKETKLYAIEDVIVASRVPSAYYDERDIDDSEGFIVLRFTRQGIFCYCDRKKDRRIAERDAEESPEGLTILSSDPCTPYGVHGKYHIRKQLLTHQGFLVDTPKDKNKKLFTKCIEDFTRDFDTGSWPYQYTYGFPIAKSWIELNNDAKEEYMTKIIERVERAFSLDTCAKMYRSIIKL